MRGAGWDDPLNDESAAEAAARRARPFVATAIALMVGIGLGRWLPWAAVWLGAGALLAGAMGVMLARQRTGAAARWGLMTVVALGAAWQVLHAGYASRLDVARYVGRTSQLAEVVGTVVEGPRLSSPKRGAFGAFSYKSPGTLLVLELRSIVVGETPTPVRGRLLVRVDEADHRLEVGQLIRAAGWLSAIEGPSNPGELDYRQVMEAQGIRGRLTVPTRDNWHLLAPARITGPVAALAHARQATAAAMQSALRLGLEENTPQLALLEALLLGLWAPELGELYESFREVGLVHILSISGSHLAILMMLAWGVVRLLAPHPRWMGWVLLAVLGVYLLGLPMQVPIVRSAIMAALFCLGYASGRSIPAMGVLGLATVVVLAWRPGDLFSPGFQLSFGLVAALLVFTRPAARWMWPPGQGGPGGPAGEPGYVRGARWVVECWAASVVTFAVALPMVAYHFGLVSPLAAVLSVLALPVITAVLGLGYLKIVTGLVLPSGSLLLGGALAWLAEGMIKLVEYAAGWPGAAVELGRRPSALWAIGVLAVVVAVLRGRYARRPMALAASAAVLAVWTGATAYPEAAARWMGRGDELPALRLNMFSVGDGSCYLVRLPGQTLMFDCGSQAYLDVGERSIGPALRELGVGRIDTLVISHADLDHYCGTLVVVDAVSVGQVLVPPQLLQEAEAQPRGATAYLVAELRARGLEPRATTRGWRQTVGEAELEMLWPTAGVEIKRSNDTSLVLSIRVAGRRVLLNGDIGEQAMAGLLAAEGDLRADVVELPHHGSFNALSPAWLAAVRGEETGEGGRLMLLQSCGEAGLRRDRWAALLAGQPIDRIITAETGMAELTIAPDGAIAWSTVWGASHPAAAQRRQARPSATKNAGETLNPL